MQALALELMVRELELVGKAARDWPSFHAIVRELEALGNDETLLVQSGKPVGVFRTHEYAPRVLIANSNLVGAWANWEQFHELERKGLMMYGQMTAGSWIYIGSQGIVQGTYETFVEMGRQHYGGDLKGKWILTAGLGGMGGAQPLAITMNGGVALCIEVDGEHLRRRIEIGYLDEEAEDLEDAIACEGPAITARAVLAVDHDQGFAVEECGDGDVVRVARERERHHAVPSTTARVDARARARHLHALLLGLMAG